MFALGVACDTLCLYIWPSEGVIEDAGVLLFFEQISIVDSLLSRQLLSESCVQGDLAELVKYTRSNRNLGLAIWRELAVTLAYAYTEVEIALSLQMAEAARGDFVTWMTIILWVQFLGIAAYTIWARGVGPRFRPDQMSDLTWKDLLLLLAGLLVMIIATFCVARCVVTLLDWCVLCFVTVSVFLARARCSKIKQFSCMLAGAACEQSWHWSAYRCWSLAATCWT